MNILILHYTDNGYFIYFFEYKMFNNSVLITIYIYEGKVLIFIFNLFCRLGQEENIY